MNLQSYFKSLLCVCCLVPSWTFAQSERVSQLEAEAIAASGPKRVEKLIVLADACLAEGQLKKAESAAEEAEDFAKKFRRNDLRAIALNRQGKIMVAGGKRRAGAKFRQSLELVHDQGGGDKALALDNLESLRALVLKNGDADDLPKIDEQIAWLKGVRPAVAPALPPAASLGAPTPPAPNIANPNGLTKQELRQELSSMQQVITAAHQSFQRQQMKLMQESKVLQAELAQKKAALDSMTETQMKTAMVLLQQRYVLDSLSYRANIDSLAISNWNLALREAEAKRNVYLAGMVLMLLFASGVGFSWLRARQYSKTLEEKNAIIREEQARSENLLLNILPALVADELKAKGHTEARPFEEATVLFADFVGFSKIAEKITPQQLVSDLDTCFQAFDGIVAMYGLEKIKTIGDAYMCAGGLPTGGSGAQAREMVKAALEMQDWLNTWNKERDLQNLPRYDARIGIHCGPVVAGVVGSKKFAFDIWGDTVNIAARVEQAGEGGRINISGVAYEIVREYFPCEYRGKVAVKNKGEIDMYFVNT